MRTPSNTRSMNTRKYLTKAFWGLVLLFFLACKQTGAYSDIAADFESYLNHISGQEISGQNEIYLVLPMDICPSCLEKIKGLLEAQTFRGDPSVYLVMSSKTKKEANFFLNDALRGKYNIIYDKRFEVVNTSFYKNSMVYFFKYEEGRLSQFFYFNLAENFDRFAQQLGGR